MLATLEFPSYHLVGTPRSRVDTSLSVPREVGMQFDRFLQQASLAAVQQQAMWSWWTQSSYLKPRPVASPLFYTFAFAFDTFEFALLFCT
jgi:hypothetical protein